VIELLKKARAVMARRMKRGIKPAEVLKLVLEEFLDRVDPVRKAERALKRTTKPMMETAENTAENTAGKHSVQTKFLAKVRKKRTPIAACARHIVNARDQARCTFIDPAPVRGKRPDPSFWQVGASPPTKKERPTRLSRISV
jgi:hypothetical protein